MKRIVSFDIGVKRNHLTYCIFHGPDLFKWAQIDLGCTRASDVVIRLPPAMKAAGLGEVDEVLIERQFNANTKAIVISHLVQSWYVHICDLPTQTVLFVKPRDKFN